MAYIRVIYRKGKYDFDYVSSKLLDTLIIRDEITHFYRPAERRWINIKLDPLRGKGGFYRGPDRRTVINRPDEAVQKAEPVERERDRSSDWLKGLWRNIEKL